MPYSKFAKFVHSYYTDTHIHTHQRYLCEVMDVLINLMWLSFYSLYIYKMYRILFVTYTTSKKKIEIYLGKKTELPPEPPSRWFSLQSEV